MAIIQKIYAFYKKRLNFLSILDAKTLKIQRSNPFILIFFLIILSIIFFISSNLINKINEQNEKNIKEIAKTSEFSNFTNYLISRINSPYQEITYVIKNNDTVEKIFKKFKIRNEDINNISTKLKQKKLSNIYSGRKLSLVFKKLEDGSNTLVNFVYPINNTTSIEIRKSQDDFLVKENILQLYKKEVVKKTLLKITYIVQL